MKSAGIENLYSRLKESMYEAGKNYSGGQKQRITIAREIYRNPDILIFDGEPETHVAQLGDADRFRHIIKDGQLVDTSTPLPKQWHLPGWRVSQYSEKILTKELVQSMGLNL